LAEAVQRAAIIAEAEGMEKIEATHLERILPQLLLDF
jgi:centromere protein X